MIEGRTGVMELIEAVRKSSKDGRAANIGGKS